MDVEELRAALGTRERFAPDPDAVRDTVLAHPPRQRVRRSPRRFAAIGIAATVVLVAGTVGVVRSTTHDVTAPPPVPAPSKTVLAAKLERTSWSLATVATAGQGTPLSAGPADFLSLLFNPDGTLLVGSPLCRSETVPWTATELSVTIGRVTPQVDRCSKGTEATSAAAAPLAAAFHTMTTSPTQGHLDGRSLVLQAGSSLLVFRYEGTQSAAVSGLIPPSIDGAVRQWAGFPLTARPRPVVLMNSPVVLPTAPLPDGEQENALAAGRITLATTAPAAPATMRGYPILTARAAIAEFTDPQQIAADRLLLHITKMQLVDQDFHTDRGDVPLPTWKVTIAESHDAIYVLAVAAAGRFPAVLTDDVPVGQNASLTGDGRDITISFVPHHVSEGGCDRDRTSTFASRETSTAVVLVVTTQLHPESPEPGCKDGYSWFTAGYPGPGQPDTTTLHLKEPLGNRVVVDQYGTPYVINQ